MLCGGLGWSVAHHTLTAPMRKEISKYPSLDLGCGKESMSKWLEGRRLLCPPALPASPGPFDSPAARSVNIHLVG